MLFAVIVICMTLTSMRGVHAQGVQQYQRQFSIGGRLPSAIILISKNFPEIFFRASSNNGNSFGSTINLSNSWNAIDSDDPRIAVEDDYLYVIWEEGLSSGLDDYVLFRTSNDNGITFGSTINISGLVLLWRILMIQM